MNIYIGYDPLHPEPHAACKNSLFRNMTSPHFFKIVRLSQDDLRNSGIYYREDDDLASTPFSLTRFLVPALNGFSSWALYCDADFIFLKDIETLLEMRDHTKAVQVVQHPSYELNGLEKMDGQQNYNYPKKNWSSLMLFNCEHEACRELTPEVVNSLPPASLHQFEWCDEHEVGNLPLKWNWLVSYYSSSVTPHALHFTDGGPWLDNYQDVPYADIWKEYAE